jgi:hypothetical protein
LIVWKYFSCSSLELRLRWKRSEAQWKRSLVSCAVCWLLVVGSRKYFGFDKYFGRPKIAARHLGQLVMPKFSLLLCKIWLLCFMNLDGTSQSIYDFSY